MDAETLALVVVVQYMNTYHSYSPIPMPLASSSTLIYKKKE